VYFNNTKVSRKQPLLTKKALQEIERRQLYALRANNYSDIMDAKEKVIKIIDDDGLSSDEQKTRLDTALKVLEYIIPKKKSTELTISTRKLEDIISESIEEAQIIDEPKTNVDKDNENKV
jgi:hypothetical protein